MFEPYEIAERIKLYAREKNMTVKSLLKDAGVGEKMVSNMSGKNGSYPQSDKIAQIAKILDCSVDYLLGRTDNPNVTGISVTDNNQMSLTGNNSISINANPNNSTSDDRQLFDMIKNLDLVDRSKIILHIDELKNKK